MKKKLLSVLLTLAMVLTMIPMATGVAWAAEEGTQANPWQIGAAKDGGGTYDVKAWLVENDLQAGKYTLHIEGTGAMKDYGKKQDQPWDASRTSITSVEIGENVTNIGNYAFSGCTNLTNITIRGSVTRIGESAFESCNTLENIIIPASIKSIGCAAFQGCTSLTNITIPASTTSIDSYAFQGCTSIRNITIPASMTSIGESAFNGCSQLATVTCLATTPPTLGGFAFCGGVDPISDIAIYVPAGSIEAYKVADGWKNYESIITTTATGTNLNPWYIGASTSSDIKAWLVENTPATTPTTYTLHIEGTGAMKDYGKKQDQPWDASRTSITSVEIGENVTNIGNYAFYGCTILKNITIRESVKSIGRSSFQNCEALIGVTVPASVASINPYAFCNCTSLTNITFNRITPPNLSGGAFQDCVSLTTIHVPAGKAFDYITASSWGTYKDKIAVTIADVLATADGEFPETKDAGWVSEKGAICYLGESGLKFIKDNDELSASKTASTASLLDKFEWSDGNYIYTPLMGPWSLTFNMEDDKLVSITLVATSDTYKSLAGTYTEPASGPETPVYHGGSYTPPTVNVPVSTDTGSVYVSATVSGEKATVGDISEKDIEKVVSGDKDTAVVEIDLSGLDKTISEVDLPVKTVEKIAEATQASGKEEAGMSVKMSAASVTFDVKATQAMVDQAEGNTIQLVVDDIKSVSLNAVQKEAVEKLDTAIILDAYLVSNGTKLCTESNNGFAGGKATVALQYEIKNNRTPLNYKVFYVDDNGKLTNLKAKYNEETKCFEFGIEHFSNYALVYDENAELEASRISLTKTTTYKNGKIKLTFKRLKLSDGKKITSYQIYRSTSKKFNKNLKKYSIKRTANTKSYTWTNSKKLKKGTKYYYKVRGRVKLSDGTYAYTQWSKVKTAKCKKSR